MYRLPSTTIRVPRWLLPSRISFPARGLLRLGALAGFLAFAETGVAAQGNEHEWTSNDGVSIRAELLGTDGHSVLFRMSGDGRLRSTPLNRLSADDRERALNGAYPRLPVLDFSRAPTESEIIEILRSGLEGNWTPLAAHLRNSLLTAHGQGNENAVQHWYYFYRWLDLFRQEPFHSDLASGNNAFGRDWPPRLRLFVCRDAGFSREFFRLISPHDRLDRVSEILGSLYRDDPETFAAYSSLALAIAVVYDQSPPRNWPLRVPGDLLPSGFMEPSEAFAFFVSSHNGARLLMDPRNLRARDLRFVVDAIAPREELLWAQQRIRSRIAQFDRTYSMIQYDYSRYGSNVEGFSAAWPHDDYRLETIRRRGGICGDQAYFATQVGKALGLPTVYFSGYGDYGSHAWMGYFEGQTRGWNLDVGRYALNNYMTGYTLDPQTWQTLNDHEIAFQRDPFHRLDAYRQSLFHSNFAREFHLAGRTSEALRAARRAVDREPRNRRAWDLVAEIQWAGQNVGAYENALRQAADAFRQYPHVNAHYRGLLAESLHHRDEFDEALAVIQEISRDNRRERPDISLRYSKRFLELTRDNGDVRTLVDTYRNILSHLRNHVSSSNFVFEVARPFLTELHQGGHRTETRLLISQTRRQLNIPRNTLAGQRLYELDQALR